MSKKYKLKLTGFVGGYSFDPSFVDYKLDILKDEEVIVKIDSLGGSVGSALSISSAFKNHGNVKVHFVGLNASAATIASLGASHISMEPSAMYLAHKASISFWEFASMNADQLEEKIKEYQQSKNDLDKIDANIAEMYSKKCKKSKAELLELMKVGGWLTAQEALEWGFIDKIEAEKDSNPINPQITSSAIRMLQNQGIELPNIPLAENDSKITKLFAAISNWFSVENSFQITNSENPDNPDQNSIEHPTNSNNILMNKVYTLVCAILKVQNFALENNSTSISDEQLQAIENAISEKDQIITDLQNSISEKDKQIKALLKNPAEETLEVIDKSKEKNSTSDFFDTCQKASELHNLIH